MVEEEEQCASSASAICTAGQYPVPPIPIPNNLRSSRAKRRATYNAAISVEQRVGFVSFTTDESRGRGLDVVSGGCSRTCLPDACATALGLAHADRQKLRAMMQDDVKQDMQIERANQVLTVHYQKKIVPVTREFTGTGGIRLNILRIPYRQGRKLLVQLLVKVPNAEVGDSHIIYSDGIYLFNNTSLNRTTRRNDMSSYPVTLIQETDFSAESARRVFDSLYPSRWVTPQRVFAILDI